MQLEQIFVGLMVGCVEPAIPDWCVPQAAERETQSVTAPPWPWSA